jgi:integrase
MCLKTSGWDSAREVLEAAVGARSALSTSLSGFRQLVMEFDLPPIRLHDLRHGAATIALASHTDLKVIQQMLGHSSIVTTADTSTKARVLHQAGEKPQVSRSWRSRNSVSDFWAAAV